MKNQRDQKERQILLDILNESVEGLKVIFDKAGRPDYIERTNEDGTKEKLEI